VKVRYIGFARGGIGWDFEFGKVVDDDAQLGYRVAGTQQGIDQ
jgi:hypothetical protein